MVVGMLIINPATNHLDKEAHVVVVVLAATESLPGHRRVVWSLMKECILMNSVINHLSFDREVILHKVEMI